MATVRSDELLAKLEDLNLILRERIGHVEHSSGAVRTACDIQIWWQVGGRKAKANMEETDGERLLLVEARDSCPSRKELLEIRCEIRYACS